MSDVTATLLAAILGAVIGGMIGMAGSLVGLFVPRYLRTRGDIMLRTSRWEMWPTENHQDSAAYAYKLSIYIYNDMEIDTAAQDVEVLLGKNADGETLVSTPKEAVEPYYRLDSVALPSRASVNRDVAGKIGSDTLKERFGDSSDEISIKWVRLKGLWPTGKPFIHEVLIDGTVNDHTSKHRQWLV